MINQILKTNLVLLMLFFACKKDEAIPTNTLLSEHQKQSSKDSAVKTLSNKVYALNITAALSSDTLDIVDYKTNKYSSPIILHQKLSFFRHGKLLKNYEIPAKKIKVKTITNNMVNIIRTPIYKICINKGLKEDFYIVQAAEYDYCNGSDCLEFLGIYSMSGSIIYEGYSNEESKTSLKDILIKNEIELKKSTNCIRTDEFE